MNGRTAPAAATIKVGMLISYDYAYARHSLPRLYEHADRIVLAVDRDSRSWTGEPYEIPDAFWNWIREIDVSGKIEVYRDDFHLPHLSTIENDTRERNLLARQMGEGGWHVQVDSDEYFADFGAFARFLRRNSAWTRPGAPPLDIGVFWIPLYRQVDGGFLFMPDCFEPTVVATTCPDYKVARKSNHPIRYVPASLFHQTWARGEAEILRKLSSWGHSADFNIQHHFDAWKSASRVNYKAIRNFHPLIPTLWPRLEWCPGQDVCEFIRNYRERFPLGVPKRVYWRRRLGQLKKAWLDKLRQRETGTFRQEP
ncbi:MAG TPA: hypothetical protein PKX16_01760 [Kiritimatiellia bacterium]|nr:hypothetical protein [Kiritimatiellia bacterium]